ncbi:hypothetical protein [Campylobacter pinnipediorum]|nr:hypothetical protein [Campylobacter pinnipediorum]
MNYDLDEYIRAIRVCRYFRKKGIKHLMLINPNLKHLEIALELKLKGKR